MKPFVPLHKIANIGLGFKSLQNKFYYIDKATIEYYGIEKKFLRDIVRLRNLQTNDYYQKPKSNLYIFYCKDKPEDLRGTGAGQYINAMAGHSATKKKQASGTLVTIKEALEKQGGTLWYAPKAKAHSARLWLRKAFGSIYSPFVFLRPTVMDQRCNYIAPKGKLQWKLLGALFTTTVFSYALEINGSASLGAGALEAPTSKLRYYPVLDPASIDGTQQSKLIKYAEYVWEDGRPIDWRNQPDNIDKHIRRLDEYVLHLLGRPIDINQLYGDLYQTCNDRMHVAQDKSKKTKKQKSDSIDNVANDIVNRISLIINSKQFPESFFSEKEGSLYIYFDKSDLVYIDFQQLINRAEIEFYGRKGNVIFSGNYPLAIAELIVRSALFGREKYTVPENENLAQVVLSGFEGWFSKIYDKIETEINESSMGTGYEKDLRLKVYDLLQINPLVLEKRLPNKITIKS